MKKIYISPATDVVVIKLRDGILITPSQAGNQYSNEDIDPDAGDPSEGGNTGGDLSRDNDNNRNSVWDNLW